MLDAKLGSISANLVAISAKLGQFGHLGGEFCQFVRGFEQFCDETNTVVVTKQRC